jgi:hypothetical protein
LARQAVIDGLVPSISARTVRRILQEVDLQPHRTRYWKTARLDALFKARTEKILWCYANAQRLVHSGFWIVCVDEMPNLQALERRPLRRAIPGSIEQQEFEYIRHGTVNVLVFLIVHSGRMQATCPVRKDAAHRSSTVSNVSDCYCSIAAKKLPLRCAGEPLFGRHLHLDCVQEVALHRCQAANPTQALSAR